MISASLMLAVIVIVYGAFLAMVALFLWYWEKRMDKRPFTEFWALIQYKDMGMEAVQLNRFNNEHVHEAGHIGKTIKLVYALSDFYRSPFDPKRYYLRPIPKLKRILRIKRIGLAEFSELDNTNLMNDGMAKGAGAEEVWQPRTHFRRLMTVPYSKANSPEFLEAISLQTLYEDAVRSLIGKAAISRKMLIVIVIIVVVLLAMLYFSGAVKF